MARLLFQTRSLLLMAALPLAAAPLSLRAQQSQPPAQSSPQQAAPGQDPGDANPFPADESKKAAQTAQQAPQQAAPPDANPFPEAESKAAAKAADSSESAGDGGGSTVTGDSDSSSSRTRMKGLDLLGDHDSNIDDGAGHVIQDPKLGEKDVKIGQLYMARGDYAGAYSRLVEATKVAPGNADAVFYLAEAARKTAHLDEAAENFKVYLDADPKGKHAKDAAKALAELSGK